MSQGKTIEAALENVKEAIALYLDVEGDRRPPETRTALTTVVEV